MNAKAREEGLAVGSWVFALILDALGESRDNWFFGAYDGSEDEIFPEEGGRHPREGWAEEARKMQEMGEIGLVEELRPNEFDDWEFLWK